MLSIGKLARATNLHPHRGVNYYLGRVASGVEDYYTGAGEAPGEWIGAGAAELGLEGAVDGADLRSISEAATASSPTAAGSTRRAAATSGDSSPAQIR